MAPSDPPAPPVGRRLAASAGIIGSATLTSRILGLVRDQLLAFLFGAGNAMDAFNVAFRIPNLMRDLFAEGAMSAAFVPTFTRRLAAHGKAAAWRVGNQLINALVVVTGGLVLFGILGAGPLTQLLAGSYAAVPGKLELTVTLTRILLPFLTLVAVAAAVMGMLNALDRFFTPALSPAMFNVGIILGALTLVPILASLGVDPIIGIAVGAILGGFGQIAVQLPALYREGFRYRCTLDPRDPDLRAIVHLIGPATLAGAAVQINLLVNMVLATGEGTGAVSWLNYAFRVMFLPIGIFGVSIATATLPTVSRHAAQAQLGEIRHTISRALRMMLILNVPAMVGLIVLAVPIVGLIFERGSFGPTDTAMTADALVFFAPGLLGYSTVRIAVPCFYALENSVTPTAISVLTVALNVVLNLILVQVLGFRGLALGTAVASLVNAGLLVLVLRRRLGGLDLERVLVTGVKVALASAVMGLAVTACHGQLVHLVPGTGLLNRLAQVFGAIGGGVAVLLLAARMLRLAEIEDVLRPVRERLSWFR